MSTVPRPAQLTGQILRPSDVLLHRRWLLVAAVIASLVGLGLLWRHCRAFALALPLATLTGVVADLGLKVLVARPRPDVAVVGTTLGSFPSGHVIQVTVAFGLLAPALYLVTGRRGVFHAALGLFGVMVVGVAASRVVLGAHWPSDILGGLLIGAAILLGAEYVVSSQWAARHCRACRLHEAPRRDPRA